MGERDEMLPEHVEENRRLWDGMADDWVRSGEDNWRRNEPCWGIWGLPESQLRLLPADMIGRRAIELGCGTGYVSAWMARRGAEVVGIDNSARQLETARRLSEQHGIALTLLHGNAEAVPYPDQSFDFAISEYGAAIWCNPKLWIPEAHRLLRPGGELVMLGCHPYSAICAPLDGSACDRSLHRPYFGLDRLDWREVAVDPGGIEFNLTVSDWLRLFRDTGFEVLDYLELRAPEGLDESRFFVSAEWARQWPAEQAWKLRRI